MRPGGVLSRGLGGAIAALLLAGCSGVVTIETSGGGGGSGATGAGAGGTGAGGAGGIPTGGGGSVEPCLCISDIDCAPGATCDGCFCVGGCSEGCPEGAACCDGSCTPTGSDMLNCGGCGVVCGAPQAEMVCVAGGCEIAICAAGYSDCDGDAANGCETAGGCNCVAGEVAVCYTGPPGTEGVGACQSGTQECVGGDFWSDCQGEVVPQPESCNGADDDCDGHDDAWDGDGDGWTPCDGDCCEGGSCALEDPQKINPGALEYLGNEIDDDCDASTTELAPYPTCGPGHLGGTGAVDLMKAMDVCQLTAEDAPLPAKKWGLLEASLALADGSTAIPPSPLQWGVLAQYGGTAPKYGPTMAALSSGTARAEGDPGFVYPQNGPEAGQIGNFKPGTICPIPADFLAGNGGSVPTPCSPCNSDACKLAIDSILLKARIRVPTNVVSFSVDADFFTAEYPENLCSQYNDFFVALLDSQHPDIPADHNVAYGTDSNPISVNDTFLHVCAAPTCDGGTLEIIGTGMGGWNGVITDGAATGWVRMDAPVVPGETIELRFAIWDAMDGNVDSLVLLDRFRWSIDGSVIMPFP